MKPQSKIRRHNGYGNLAHAGLVAPVLAPFPQLDGPASFVLLSVFARDGYMSYRGTIFGDRSSWAIFAAWKIVIRT